MEAQSIITRLPYTLMRQQSVPLLLLTCKNSWAGSFEIFGGSFLEICGNVM
jgi:hypothetical protein